MAESLKRSRILRRRKRTNKASRCLSVTSQFKITKEKKGKFSREFRWPNIYS